MKKTTLGRSITSNRFLPVAAGFMLMPSFLFAQTEKDVQEIRKNSNLKDLNILRGGFNKETLTAQQLMKKAKEKGLIFSGENQGKYFQLRGFDKKTGKPLYYITHNTDAAIGTSVDKLQGELFNLNGEGMRVHEWDGGALAVNHPEFQGRAVQKDNATTPSSHATHVAGTMIAGGVVPKAKGMAPKANLDAYDWNSDEAEMTQAAENGALVSNHSYGYLSGFVYGQYSGNAGWHWVGRDEDTEFALYGKYTSYDRRWDAIAVNAPYYLPVRAAGNPRGDGPEPGGLHYVQVFDSSTNEWKWVESTKVRQKNGGEFGFDSTNFGALGKNILTIGAASKIPNGYQQASDVSLASFSAFGPVDDGRIKPDLSGIGVNLYSTSTGNPGYATLSGTSMASPNITGSLLLLQEHYKKLNNDSFMKAATLKALAIATANEAGSHDGPDYSSGWGLLNAHKAALAISTRDKYTLISEGALNNNEVKKINVTALGSEPLVVTIAWTDPVPVNLPNEETLNERTPMLINDLDIRVKKDGQTFMPWKLDPVAPMNAATKGDNTVDNVEQIVVDTPEVGAVYEIEISHKTPLKKNTFTPGNNGTQYGLVDTSSQDYSLIVTGINNNVNLDLAIKKVEVDVPVVDYSNATPVKIVVENKGINQATGAVLSYQLLNTDTNEVVKSDSMNLDVVPGSSSITKTINIDLSQSFVNYKILATVQVTGDEVELNNSNETTVYGYLSDLRQDGSSLNFGFEADLKRNGWTSADLNQDGRTWMKYDNPSLANTGNSFAVNFPNNTANTNDWLFSNPLKLKGQEKYLVVFSSRKFQDPVEKLSLFYGNSAEESAMTSMIAENITPVKERYKRYAFEFNTPSEQTIHLGFHNKTENGTTSYAIAVDDVIVQKANSAPLVDFYATKTKTNTYDPVEMINETVTGTDFPVTAQTWSFEPSTVVFVDGTNANSENPKVIFKEEGSYKVSLNARNAKGESELTKEAYITAKNTDTKANFTVSSSSIYTGESVELRNTSTGNPSPNDFKWTVTPSEGVEFVSPHTDTSSSPVIKFNKSGDYSISLKATSVHNSDTETKENIVQVKEIYGDVTGLEHSFDNGSGQVNLKWERPVLNPIYEEDFNAQELPQGIRIFDANANQFTWLGWSEGYNNTQAIASLSWFFGAFDADDWLVTPKLRSGAEVLKFITRNQYRERYDIYVVESPEDGSLPDLEAIKAGHKIYTNEMEEPLANFTSKEFDIKSHTEKDFYIAFHHRTKKEDDGYVLLIDNLEVGYKNTADKSQNVYLTNSEVVDYKAVAQEGEQILFEEFKKPTVTPRDGQALKGILDLPRLTGYKVEKNGEVVKTTFDQGDRTYSETLTENGSYTYTVYATYSDGKQSSGVSVTIDTSNLSTSETQGKGLKIYPNPSDGRFTVDAGGGVSSLKIEVYDMTGKQIFRKDYSSSKAELNLTQYPKGAYILNMVDNNGKKQSAKLMIK